MVVPILADDFNDNKIDGSKWVTIAISGGRVYERNSRIEFEAPKEYSGGGIKSLSPINVSTTRIRATLYSQGYVIACISIVPYDKPFYAYNSEGYTIGIWQSGLDHVFIYRNGEIVFRKFEPLLGNPEVIEIVVEDGTIKFLEAGVELYSETYGTYTKDVHVYLWGMSWYLGASGTSWADDFSATKIAVETSLTLSAPGSVAAGERFMVSGILYETETGTPIPGQPVNVSYDGRFIGGATTGVDGDYLLEVSIPEPGAWTLKAEFPGTAAYAAASSRARTVSAHRHQSSSP